MFQQLSLGRNGSLFSSTISHHSTLRTDLIVEGLWEIEGIGTIAKVSITGKEAFDVDELWSSNTKLMANFHKFIQSSNSEGMQMLS